MNRIVSVILALIACVPAQADNLKLPTTQGNAACWGNNAGLLQDCPAPTLKTGPYVALNTDCGDSFALGGNAFYAFTIGVASGFPTKCAIRIYNLDIGRGKGIYIIGLTSIRLFPGQTITVIKTNNGWVVDPPFQIWSNDPTFYVNFTLGSDDPLGSDGLAAGQGAFKTFQTAVDTIRTQVTGGQLQADCDSVYDQTIHIFGTSVGSHLAIAITGNPATPSSCQLTKSGGGHIFDVEDFAVLLLSGFTLACSGAPCTAVNARQFVIVDAHEIKFGDLVGGVAYSATNSSSVNITGTQDFSGASGGTLIGSALSSSVTFSPTVVVNVATTANFNVWFNATLGGIITGTPTYHISGRVEGQSYACDTNAVIHFGVAHPGALSAGSASHGCQATPP